MPGVYASEPSLDESRSPFQIEWHRDGGSRPHLDWCALPLLAKPLEQDVASEGEAHHRKRLTRMGANEAPYDAVEVRCLTGVVEPTGASRLAIAGAKDQGIGRPPLPLRERQQTSQIVRADRALQSMEDQKASSMRGPAAGRLQTMELELVAITGGPPLDACREWRRSSHEFSP